MRYAIGAWMVMTCFAGSAWAQAPQQAQPQGSNAALAEQLFNQARELAKANQWAEACPKFEASLRYDPVLGTRLNLATCYERIGKLASAWGLYRAAIELAKRAGDNKRADYALKQATALEPRLPRLAIIAPASPPSGLTIKRDDTAVDLAALDVALYVDPGAHTITATAPGFEAFASTVTLVEGKTETVAIPALVATPVAPVAKPIAQVEVAPEAPARRARTRAYLAAGVSGAGMIAIGVGAVFGVKAMAKNDDAKKLCGDDLVCANADDYRRSRKLVSDGRSSATVATFAVIGGAAAVAAGAVIYLTAPRAHERATARLVPVPHARGAGLALTGTF